MIDSRFASPNMLDKISEWLKGNLRIYTESKQAPADFRTFFSEMKSLGLETKVKSAKDIKLEFNENEDGVDTSRLKLPSVSNPETIT